MTAGKEKTFVQVTTFIVFFILCQLVFLVLRQGFKIKQLEQEKELIERSRDRWEKHYRLCIYRLENRVDELTRRGIKESPEIPTDTIKAVKYAMKHAHPDNGGNADDFIRFQKCYEELTRNGG